MLTIQERRLLERELRFKVDKASISTAKKIEVPLTFLNLLTPWQKAILDHPSKRKAILAGRRTGKSTLLCFALIKAALENPDTHSMYFSITREQAKRQMWPVIQKIVDRFSLPFEVNNADLCLTCANGSRISFRGIDTEGDVRTVRGDGYALICIDEAAFQRDHLEYTCTQVIDPALTDCDGEMWLVSTPNRTCTGYFHTLTTTPTEYVVFRGDVRDNAYLARWKGKKNWKTLAGNVLDRQKKKATLTSDPSSFDREWLALWVRSGASSVVPWDDECNISSTPLTGDYDEHIIGIDFGYNDATCICVLAFSVYSPIVRVREIWEKSRATHDETMGVILEMYSKYSPYRIVADPSPGAQYLGDLRSEHCIPAYAAKKRDKYENIEQVASAFKRGEIQVDPAFSEQIESLKKLQWKDNTRTEIVGSQHCFDAIRYAWADIINKIGKAEAPDPVPDKYSDPDGYDTWLLEQEDDGVYLDDDEDNEMDDLFGYNIEGEV